MSMRLMCILRLMHLLHSLHLLHMRAEPLIQKSKTYIKENYYGNTS